MPTDRQLDDRISRWLEADAPAQLPDRVLHATFERTRVTRQQGGWRSLLGRMLMNRSILGVAGAAALVVAAAAALNLDPGPSGAGGPASAVPTPAPSVSPSSAPPAAAELGVRQGRHVMWSQGVRIEVTVPAPAWFGEVGQGILIKDNEADAPDGAGLIVFAGDPGGLYIYGDPCRWSTTAPSAPSGTVDDVVAALTAQASRDATAPVDVIIDGHAGKSLTLHVPKDVVLSECDQGYFTSWGVENQLTARYHQDPGQMDELWILDVDGDLVVLDAGYYEGTPKAVVDELRAIVESTTFGE